MMIISTEEAMVHVWISFDGNDYIALEIPQVNFKNFEDAWKNGEIWKDQDTDHSNPGYTLYDMSKVVWVKVM